MNDYLTKNVPQQTLFQPDDPCIANNKDTKPYILEHLDNIKLSTSQYIATSIFNYGPYVDNTFTLQNAVYTICRHLIKVINLKPPMKLNQDILMSKYNKLQLDSYSDTIFLIR